MLTVYSFPAGFGQPSLSPFCTKVLVHLRLAGVEHVAKRGNPQQSPTRKLPCARSGEETIADSAVIIASARDRGWGEDLDAGLDEGRRALAHVVRRTLEEHLYFAVVFSRWIYPPGWEKQKEILRGFLPAPLRPILPGVLRRGVKKSLHAQGLGRRSPEEIHALGVEDIRAVEALAGEWPFFFGETLTGTDVLVYAFIGYALASAHANPLTDAARGSPKLAGIVERVEGRYRAAGGEDV